MFLVSSNISVSALTGHFKTTRHSALSSQSSLSGRYVLIFRTNLRHFFSEPSWQSWYLCNCHTFSYIFNGPRQEIDIGKQ